MEWVAREWLIERVITDNILVSSEAGGGVIPVSNELVLKTLLVVIESLPKVEAFLCSVEFTEILSLAIFDEWVTILVKAEAIVCDVLA